MECVAERLRARGHCVVTVDEEHLSNDIKVDAFLSMARSDSALETLRQRVGERALVINSPSSVALCCNRRQLTDTLRWGGVPVPADMGNDGIWLKRSDGTAQTPLDIQFAVTPEEATLKMQMMRDAGITDIITCAHVKGDLVKFYGVRGTEFFSVHYPSEDGNWKFGDEQHNGSLHYYDYCLADLHRLADRAAELAGLTIYGGDCIIDSDGKPTIIDLNDWPSFSRCREEAAEAIVRVIDNS